MSQVVRIFVEKKNGFDVEASQILWDLKNNLGNGKKQSGVWRHCPQALT